MTDQARAAFQASTGVSRETLQRFDIYAGLLQKWNPAINLVAKTTLAHLWDRHFFDSAQLFDLAPENASKWLDLGSGGGFPGLVIAILAHERAANLQITCVESDQRKAVFLRTVIRETGINAEVLTARIEDLPPQGADIISARALAPLRELIGLAEPHLAPHGIALFPKGAQVANEMTDALETWAFRVDEYPSRTDDQAVILKIGDIRRV